MNTKLLNIKQVILEKELYPRTDYNSRVAYAYSQEMRAGVKFPIIVVASTKRGFILVDGKHRLEAKRINKEKHIQVDILEGLSDEQIYLEAIKRNVSHGQKLSPYDKTRIIINLKELRYDLKSISSIVQVPLDKIDSFVAKRTVTSTLTGKEIPIKTTISHLAGTKVDDHNIENKQENIGCNPQVIMLNHLINLIKNDLVNFEDKIVSRKMKALYRLLNKMFKVRGVK